MSAKPAPAPAPAPAPSGPSFDERVEALLAQTEAGEPSPFAAKLVAAARAECHGYEFNVWHANSDNVTGNGGDLPWGTLGTAPEAK